MGTVSIAVPTGHPRKTIVGDQYKLVRDITLSASYATGGDTGNLTTALSVNRIMSVSIEADTGRFDLVYDHANDKFIGYGAGTAGAAFDELGNGTDQSGVTGRATIYAK